MNLFRRILNIKLFRSRILDKNKYVKITGLTFIWMLLPLILLDYYGSLGLVSTPFGYFYMFYAVFGGLFLLDILFLLCFRNKKNQ